MVYRAATCYATSGRGQPANAAQDGRESRVSSCLAVATHVTEQAVTACRLRQRLGARTGLPSRMTPARSRNWRSLSRFCKKLALQRLSVDWESATSISHPHFTLAAHDDKKRKRAAEGADAPNKKASSAAISVRFPTSRDELHPVIGMRNVHANV
jgi:hypothetical protein